MKIIDIKNLILPKNNLLILKQCDRLELEILQFMIKNRDITFSMKQLLNSLKVDRDEFNTAIDKLLKRNIIGIRYV